MHVLKYVAGKANWRTDEENREGDEEEEDMRDQVQSVHKTGVV